ncbi:MAG: hypothetical protein CFE45_20400, partial [Burkholderiales bacterium PBB5]
MSRNREAGAPPSGPTPSAALPLALLATGVVAALLASQQLLSAWLSALAMLLVAAGALLSGALWGRQRQQQRVHEARQQLQLLGQLVDLWQWQTDAEHRLVRLQPPQRAPASAWVEGAFSGQALWQRFDDDEHTLKPRMLSQSPLTDLLVRQASPAGRRDWRLRGVPRFDHQGRFAGYLGVAEPTEVAEAQAAAQQGLESLLTEGPAALCLATPSPDGTGWVLRRANPAARTL